MDYDDENREGQASRLPENGYEKDNTVIVKTRFITVNMVRIRYAQMK
jgi:hypothetical protein